MTTKTFDVESRAGAREGLYIVQLQGKMTLECVFRFEDVLRDLKGPATIIDLSQVEYIDSSALGAIVRAHVSHQKEGRKLALVGVPARVAQLLTISGLNPVFTIFDTVETAEGSLA
jgi:anti-sigma B factor antagonist